MDQNLADKADERINPATYDMQVVIKDLLQQLTEGPGSSAKNYTTQKLTIDGAGKARGVAQSCTVVRVSHENSNSTYMSINQTDTDATANDWLVPVSESIVLPASNAKHLHFAGTTGDVVTLLIAD